MIEPLPSDLDGLNWLLTVAGFLVTVPLLWLSWQDWRRTHRRWAYRAMVMSVVVLIVWVGFGATLFGRTHPEWLDVAQVIALSTRLTLLALVLWLLAIHDRDSTGHP